MGIFDFRKKDEEEYYKGVKLSNDVDKALQKQLIDRGRQSEVKSLEPEKTSFRQEFSRLGETGNFMKEVAAPAIQKVSDKIYENKTVQQGLEKTVGKLNMLDDMSEGKIKSDTGQTMLVQDLPLLQQIQGAQFATYKRIGAGSLATLGSLSRALEWQGVDAAKPVADKLKDWSRAGMNEDPRFGDRLAMAFGSSLPFFIAGFGTASKLQAVNTFSPRLAALFGNSIMTTLEAMTEAGETYEELLEQTHSKEKADQGATKAFWANAVLIGLTNQVAYFNQIPGFKRLLLSSPLEAFQEFGQTVIQNTLTGRKWDEGAYEAALFGGILGGIMGMQEITVKPSKQQQTRIVDQKMLSPKMVESRLNDVAQKVNYITEGKMVEAKSTELGRKILALKDTTLAHTDSPGQFYTEVAKILKADPKFDPRMLSKEQGLAGTVKDFNLQLKIDPDTYNTMMRQGQDFYVSAVEKQAISKIAAKNNMPYENMLRIVGLVREIQAAEERKDIKPEIFKEAADMAKIEAGQTPDIIKQARGEITGEMISAENMSAIQDNPKTIYHSTPANIEAVKDGGFTFGKNSAFGEAAFFGENQNKTYGDEALNINSGEFNLKTFRTVAEQQAYIDKHGAANLADAIRKEGVFDGFIIPNADPRVGNTYGITNRELLNQKLKAQQYVSTQEARVLSKQFKFIEDLNLPLVVKEKILTPQGKSALGSYYSGMISFVKNPHKTTIPHEAVHAFMDLMLTPKQKQEVLNEVKRRYAGKKYDDAQAEERLAEDFIKYYQAKADNKNAKAPSSRLKKFFDWFIGKLKTLASKKNQDIINKLYKDIMTKRPGLIQREMIRRRLAREQYSLKELQKEYYQNPTVLTSKFLENVDVKHREFASYEFLKNLLKSKSLPLKEAERNLINDILDTQFKDQKKINMNDLRNAIISELLPLTVIESDSYADYGSTNMDRDVSHGHTTHIYNSPFNHGQTGHFGADFDVLLKPSDLEIKQIPTTDKWAVVRKGTVLTEENISENVFTVSETKAGAAQWIETRKTSMRRADNEESDYFIDVGTRGLFAHARVWDPTTDFGVGSDEANARYIAEIQSDAFQRLEKITDRSEKFFEYYETEKEALAAFEKGDKGIYVTNKDDNSDYLAEEASEIVNAFKHGWSVGYEKTQPATKEEAKFLQYKNTWHERIIREEIRRAAMDGKKLLRFPTPYAVAKIEGFAGGEDARPYQVPNGDYNTDLAPGDLIEYDGHDYLVVNAEGGEILVAPDEKVSTFSYNEALEEEIQHRWDDETMYYWENELEKYFGDITTYKKAAEVLEKVKQVNIYKERKRAPEYLEELKKKRKKGEKLSSYEISQEIGYKNIIKEYPKLSDVSIKGLPKEILDDYSYDIGGDHTNLLEKLVEEYENGAEGKIDMDKAEQEWKEKAAQDGLDLEGIYGDDQVFYGEQDGRYDQQVFIVEDGAQTETFLQPDRYDVNYDNDQNEFNHDYENILEGDTQKTVVRFYDKQVNKYLQKLRRGNLRPVEDSLGYQWLETEIRPEDKEAVEAFQTEESLEPKKFTSKEVADYYSEIENKKDNPDPDEYLIGKIEKNNSFILTSVKIKELLETDPDLKNYVSAGINRYEDGDGLDTGLPIIVGNWSSVDFGVLDGYNRVLTAIQNGQDYIEAFFAEGDIKYQMEPSKASDLEYRRDQEAQERIIEESQREMEILAAREADLSFTDSEKETGYQNFKKLAKRRQWVLESNIDEAAIKERLPNIGVDNHLFSGATDINSNELLEMFRDRLYQEEALAMIAKELTPTELAAKEKKTIEKTVKEDLIGRSPSIKQAINIGLGVEKPVRITMKENFLLKKKIRDIARGVKMGRSDMRIALTNAFRTKLNAQKNIKQAIIEYAADLPLNEKGKLLSLIKNANNEKAMVKAFARIDAALERADSLEALQNIKKTADKVKKATQTGAGIDVKYQKLIIEILEDYNFKTPTQKTIDKLKGLSNFIKENPQTEISDYLQKRLKVLEKKNARDMSAKDINELNDLLGRLWANGQLLYKMKARHDERYLQNEIDKILTTTINLDERAASGLRMAAQFAMRATDIIDGGRKYRGFNHALYRDLKKAHTAAYITARNEGTEILETIRSVKKKFSEKEQTIMMFHAARRQGGYTQAQSLLDYYADEFNFKSMDDMKMTPEMEFALDKITGYYNKYVDYLAAVYEKRENKPFIKNKYYLPYKYDYSINPKLQEQTAPELDDFVHERGAEVEQGFTFARKPGVKKVLRNDIFNIFSESLLDQHYYMRVQPVIDEISAITSSKRYQDKAGVVASQWWSDYLRAVASKGKPQASGIWRTIDPKLRRLKYNITTAILGYKISTAFLQPFAIFPAYAYIYMNEGFLPANTAIMRLAGTLTLPTYAKRITARSPGLQLRAGGELTIREMENVRYGTKLGQAWRRGSMWALKNLDLKAAAAVYQTMYSHYRRKGLSASEANFEAEQIVALTQASSETVDLPLILLSGEALKTILTFQTYVTNLWGLISHDIAGNQLKRGLKAKYNKKNEAWEVKNTILGARLRGLVGLFVLALAGGLEDLMRDAVNKAITGREYRDRYGIFVKSLLSIPSTVPLFGSIMRSKIEYGQGFSTPLTRIIEMFYEGAQGFIQPAGQNNADRHKNRKKAALKIAEAVLTTKGFSGSSQIADFAERLILSEASKTPDFLEGVILPELPDIELPELPALPELPQLQ